MAQASETQLNHLFRALADPTRRQMLQALARGDATVGQLAAPFDLAAPTITKHLNVLEQAGLLERSRDGRHRRVHLRPAPLRDAGEWLDLVRALWDDQLDAIEALLKRERGQG